MDEEDSFKCDKRLALNSCGKLDISGKRVTKSISTLMNYDKFDKFGQEKEICISENITTEKEQKKEESKYEGCFENTDNLYDDVVIDDVTHDSPDDVSEENQDDAHKSKDFKCPLKCSFAFTGKAHLESSQAFSQVKVKKIIKLNLGQLCGCDCVRCRAQAVQVLVTLMLHNISLQFQNCEIR